MVRMNLICEGSSERYQISWDSGRSTAVTSRAITSSPVETPQFQENNNFESEVDNQDNQISANVDMCDESLSGVNGRGRVSEVRMNLHS